MSDWIKLRAAEIRTAEKQKKDERDRQTEVANILRNKATPFWASLVKVLQESVLEFNAEFPETERRIDNFDKSMSTSITIRRSSYPLVLVRVQLNGTATSVHYSISRTARKGSEAIEVQGNFGFGIVDGEIGYTDGGMTGHEDVARLFLEPFFEF